MTNEHRAALMHLSNTVAMIGHRVEALESKYETMRLATLEWGKEVDQHSRWIDDHLKRIMALEAGQRPSTGATAAPADSLVERVRQAQGCGNERDARATIREVAAWVAQNGWNYAANALMGQANQ